MDIIVLLIWLVIVLIIHVLLTRFLEMRDITNKIVMHYSLVNAEPMPAPSAPEPIEIVKELDVSMEQELMEYVYNFHDSGIEDDRKLIIESEDLTARLTPNNASNIVENYTTDIINSDYECYNDIHDEYAL
jgi:hypothetical protein